MKKSKYFAIFLLSILCIFATFTFSGCNKYVKNSFEYTIEDYPSYIRFYVNGEFEIYVSTAGEYTVTYTITTDGQLGQLSETISTEFIAEKGGKHTIKISVPFSKYGGESNSTAKISNVTVTKNKVGNNYTAYAIGFGATSGVLLVGAVVVFVLDKAGVFKKRR